MTDSGGFQVFSLGASLEHGVGKIANIFPGEAGGVLNAAGRAPRVGQGTSLVKVGEEEVRFKSHIDGSEHVFTPEKSVAIQRALGADMVLAFDECTSPLHDEAYTRRSAERTHRWAARSLAYFQENGPQHPYAQALYGIVQGGAFEAPRRESAGVIAGMDFDALAIGGNLGRTKEDMHRVIDWTVAELPRDKPRHLLGIGEPPDVFEAVARGCDTFDCVSPTRNARNGGVLKRLDDDGAPLPKFRLNMRNAGFANDPAPHRPRLRLLHVRALLESLPPPLVQSRGAAGPLLSPPSITSASWRGSARRFGRVYKMTRSRRLKGSGSSLSTLKVGRKQGSFTV